MRTPLFPSLAMAAAALLGAAACAAWARQQEPSEVAAGRRIAERYCGECHATGGRDLSRLPEAPPFRHLHRQFDVSSLPGRFEDGMMVGHPHMPLVHLDEDELGYLMAYLNSFNPSTTMLANAKCQAASC